MKVTRIDNIASLKSHRELHSKKELQSARFVRIISEVGPAKLNKRFTMDSDRTTATGTRSQGQTLDTETMLVMCNENLLM